MTLHDPRPLAEKPDPATGKERSRPLATFGRYLLFRRLKRDELGDVYRAGQLGTAAVERMVKLRLFSGEEIDGERFWNACQDRVELRTALREGPFAEVVDLGCESGVAFVAHELLLGRSLEELLVQAREASDPAPLAHTLHLVDRIAIGLQNAHQTRLREQRVIHGFLIPDFVHVSSEGEVRLAGFESTGGLLDLSPSGPARSRLAGYLSPEVNAGQPPTASDDIYSMASIFAELLSGEPTPALGATEAGDWVDAATLAADGSPIPDDIRSLLRESLVPRDQRIQTPEQWHRALSEIAAVDGRSSTTFDLAFFLHELFGHTLEQEAVLVEAEMRAEIPQPAPPAETAAPEPDAEEPAPAEAADGEPADGEPAEPVLTDRDELTDGAVAADEPVEPAVPVRRSATESKAQSAPAGTSGRKWIAVGATLVALLGLGAAYLFFGPSTRGAETPVALVVAAAPRLGESTPAPATLEPQDGLVGISEVAPPLSPEELESQVRSLVSERAGDLEANLKAEYDKRLVELRRQLEEARKTAPAASAPVAAAPVRPPRPAPAATDSTASSAPAGGAPASALREPPTEPSTEPVIEPKPLASAPRSAAEPAGDRERAAVPETATRLAPEPAPPAVEEPAAAAEAEARPVEAGAIVVNGPGVTPPKLVRQPNVVYPAAAARLKRQASVRVRILVDEKGKPSEIEQIGKKVGLGFDSAALHAARTTRWSPPERDGVPVKMWVELSIDFRP